MKTILILIGVLALGTSLWILRRAYWPAPLVIDTSQLDNEALKIAGSLIEYGEDYYSGFGRFGFGKDPIPLSISKDGVTYMAEIPHNVSGTIKIDPESLVIQTIEGTIPLVRIHEE